MDTDKYNRINKALNKRLGKKFKVIASKNDFHGIYGPGVDLEFILHKEVTLRKVSWAEKTETFMVLIVGEENKTIWVPYTFINIEIPKEDDTE